MWKTLFVFHLILFFALCRMAFDMLIAIFSICGKSMTLAQNILFLITFRYISTIIILWKIFFFLILFVFSQNPIIALGFSTFDQSLFPDFPTAFNEIQNPQIPYFTRLLRVFHSFLRLYYGYFYIYSIISILSIVREKPFALSSLRDRLRRFLSGKIAYPTEYRSILIGDLFYHFVQLNFKYGIVSESLLCRLDR